MTYPIKAYTRAKANKLNVQIKPSQSKNKKIDVFKDNKKIVSIGDTRYMDYPSYLAIDKTLANERRRLYKIRHKNDKNLAGFYANKLLW